MTQDGKERVREFRALEFDGDCSLIAAVVDNAGEIVMFSNGTGSKAIARATFEKLLSMLGPEAQDAELAVA